MIDLVPGQRVLDRYLVGALLGEGGMGKVFQGEHMMLGVVVALKVLTVANSPEILARFQREAKLMAMVRHPNVVSVLDYGFLEDGSPCIAMEFIQGEALDRRIERCGAPSWQDAVELILGILAGLEAVHKVAIVHRDLKPSNVIIAPGDPEVVKLIDFGIAKTTDASSTKMTRTGQMVGTPAYMAPEQFLEQGVDARTDLYTTGLMLYELLSGDLPYAASGVTGMAAAFKRLQGPPPAPTAPAGRPPIPDALQDLLASILQADIKQRPSSARELTTALTAIKGSPGPATAPVAAPRAATAPPVSRAAEPEAFQATAIARPGAMTGATGASTGAGTGTRARFLLAAKLPPSRLSSAEDRRWLSDLARSSGRGFTLGAQYWFLLQGTLSTPDLATKGARDVAAYLEEYFAALVKVEWALVDETFAITASSLSGAAKLPPALSDLIAKLK